MTGLRVSITAKNETNLSFILSHKVITCPPLRKIDRVNINPVRCLNEPTNFNDGCAQSCKSGFKFVSGEQKRVCRADGTWSGSELICKGRFKEHTRFVKDW